MLHSMSQMMQDNTILKDTSLLLASENLKSKSNLHNKEIVYTCTCTCTCTCKHHINMHIHVHCMCQAWSYRGIYKVRIKSVLFRSESTSRTMERTVLAFHGATVQWNMKEKCITMISMNELPPPISMGKSLSNQSTPSLDNA